MVEVYITSYMTNRGLINVDPRGESHRQYCVMVKSPGMNPYCIYESPNEELAQKELVRAKLELN